MRGWGTPGKGDPREIDDLAGDPREVWEFPGVTPGKNTHWYVWALVKISQRFYEPQMGTNVRLF